MSWPGYNGLTLEYYSIVIRYGNEVGDDQEGKAFYTSKPYYLIICILSG
jgi:hypothetical protein